MEVEMSKAASAQIAAMIVADPYLVYPGMA